MTSTRKRPPECDVGMLEAATLQDNDSVRSSSGERIDVPATATYRTLSPHDTVDTQFAVLFAEGAKRELR